jgi:hypothetical protein
VPLPASDSGEHSHSGCAPCRLLETKTAQASACATNPLPLLVILLTLASFRVYSPLVPKGAFRVAGLMRRTRQGDIFGLRRCFIIRIETEDGLRRKYA